MSRGGPLARLLLRGCLISLFCDCTTSADDRLNSTTDVPCPYTLSECVHAMIALVRSSSEARHVCVCMQHVRSHVVVEFVC